MGARPPTPLSKRNHRNLTILNIVIRRVNLRLIKTLYSIFFEWSPVIVGWDMPASHGYFFGEISQESFVCRLYVIVLHCI